MPDVAGGSDRARESAGPWGARARDLGAELATRLSPWARDAAALLRSPLVIVLAWVLCVTLVMAASSGTGPSTFKFDATIYYDAVVHWRRGGSLYDWYFHPLTHEYPFTYTPLAAWVFVPLTALRRAGLQTVLTALTPVTTAITAAAGLRVLGADRRTALAAAPWLTLAASSWLEPFRETLYEGQVNAPLMALVTVDVLLVPAASRARGVLSALAAAVKLTPAIAVLVFLARREYRAAATMVGTAIVVTALTALVSPHESWRFFTQAMWDPSRAGDAEFGGNQNIKGTIARILPESSWVPVWAVLSALLLLATWVLLLRLDRLRRVEPSRGGLVLALQLAVTMVAGLLVSPISWSHHWVWSLPALLAMAAATLAWRSRPVGVVTILGGVIIDIGYHWYLPVQNHAELTWPWWDKVLGSGYTLWALAAGVVLWRAVSRRTPDAQPHAPRS